MIKPPDQLLVAKGTNTTNNLLKDGHFHIQIKFQYPIQPRSPLIERYLAILHENVQSQFFFTLRVVKGFISPFVKKKLGFFYNESIFFYIKSDENLKSSLGVNIFTLRIIFTLRVAT